MEGLRGLISNLDYSLVKPVVVPARDFEFVPVILREECPSRITALGVAVGASVAPWFGKVVGMSMGHLLPVLSAKVACHVNTNVTASMAKGFAAAGVVAAVLGCNTVGTICVGASVAMGAASNIPHVTKMSDEVSTQFVVETLPDLRREAVHDMVQAHCFGLPRDQRGYELTRQKVITALMDLGAKPCDLVKFHPHILAAYYHVSVEEQAVYNRLNRPLDVLVQMQTHRQTKGGTAAWVAASAASFGLWPRRKE